MRWLGAFLLSLWLTCSAFATFVQGVANNASASAGPLGITLGAVGTGNCVWGVISINSNAAQTITGTLGGVSFNILDQVVDTTNGQTSTTFILGNISGSPTAVSLSWTGGSFDVAAIAVEESGCAAAANPTDGAAHTGTLVTPAQTNPASANVTTTTASDIIVGAVLNDGGTTTFTAGSGFTLRTTTLLSALFPLATEDNKILVTPGTVNSSFGNTQSQVYEIFVIAIKPTATANCPVLALLGVGC